MAQPDRNPRGFGNEFRDKLLNTGCVLRHRGRGDYDVWYSPINNRSFTVPVWIKSRYTAMKILRDAGLSKVS
jgi:hypothetical protein